MGDHDQLKQVFLNLCLNSIEAMGEGGTLIITVGSDGRQESRTLELIIEISDTGTGIPTEHLSNIFEPFFNFLKTREPVWDWRFAKELSTTIAGRLP